MEPRLRSETAAYTRRVGGRGQNRLLEAGVRLFHFTAAGINGTRDAGSPRWGEPWPPKTPEPFRSRRAYIGRSMLGRTEADLIRASRGGDGVAFAELIRPSYPLAFKVAYGMLQDHDEAEDAIQEASLKAWRRLGNLREGTSLRPWFLGIVANQCRSTRRARWWSVVKGMDRPDLVEGIPGDMAQSVDLRQALSQLNHDDRLVIVLRYYLDLPIEEVGQTLGITPQATKSRLHRAIGRLRPMVQAQEALV